MYNTWMISDTHGKMFTHRQNVVEMMNHDTFIKSNSENGAPKNLLPLAILGSKVGQCAFYSPNLVSGLHRQLAQ